MSDKAGKTKISRIIIHTIQNLSPPGRFLERDTNLNSWVEVREKRASIIETEWETVAQKAKQKNTSSVFSNRIHSVYKCLLDSKLMMNVFLQFYSALIKKGFYLK